MLSERFEDIIKRELNMIFLFQGRMCEKGMFSEDYFKGRLSTVYDVVKELTGEEVNFVVNFNEEKGTGEVKAEAHVFLGTKLYFTYQEKDHEEWGTYYQTVYPQQQ